MNLFNRRRAMMAAVSVLKKFIVTSVNGIVSFLTNVAMPTKVTCEFSPVQSGTGDPSPSNIRSISGWTGCEITHTGKNLFDANNLIVGSTYDLNGEVSTEQSRAITGKIKVNPSSPVYVSYSYSSLNKNPRILICQWDKSGLLLSRTASITDNPYTATLDQNCDTVGVSFYSADTTFKATLWSNYMISQSQSAYEAYQGSTKSINWNLPDEYQEVEYLENSGTQYIATDYKPVADGLSIEFSYEFTASISGDKMMMGVRTGSNLAAVVVECYNGNSWYVTCGEARYNNVLAQKGKAQNTKYSFSVNQSTLTVDSNTANKNATYSESTMSELYLFAWNDSGSAQYIHPGLRLYRTTFKNNGFISADFIPCVRKSDSEPGMYDLVASKFYANAGTGSFSVGSNVSTLPTYYGGTVTLNEDGSADLVVDYAYEVLDSSHSLSGKSAVSGRTRWNVSLSENAWRDSNGYSRDFVSNVLTSPSGAGNSDNYPGLYQAAIRAVKTIGIGFPTECDTEQLAKAWLDDNNVTIVYRLATPVTYHFPTICTLNSFIGTNSIWHDMNGSITVEYYKNT